MKVNLSRIHNMLKQLGADVRAKYALAMRPLAAGGFSFKIFEGTTDADLAEFLAKVKAKKRQIEGIFDETRQIMAYCAFLRGELDRANSENGVSGKLLQLGCMQKEAANLARIRDIIAISCSGDFDPPKGADYYKTSFTDTQKVYELSMQMFSDKDLAAIEKEIEKQARKMNSLKDQIALINQTTVIEILSFEEFTAKSK